MSSPSPMIPVLDDRLSCPPASSKDHKDRIQAYNDMLEDVFHRELELDKLRASLKDMRTQLIEDGDTLDTSGTLLLPSVPAEVSFADLPPSERDDSDEHASSSEEGTGSTAVQFKTLSSGAASAATAGVVPSLVVKKQRRGSKGKFKGKGRERSRISGEEMNISWDYRVEVSKKTHVRRGSSDIDISESEDDETEAI